MSVSHKLRNKIKRHEQSIRTTGKYKGRGKHKNLSINDVSELDETDNHDLTEEDKYDYIEETLLW
jgi:hypothetical protein